MGTVFSKTSRQLCPPLDTEVRAQSRKRTRTVMLSECITNGSGSVQEASTVEALQQIQVLTTRIAALETAAIRINPSSDRAGEECIDPVTRGDTLRL